ncbi:TIGR03960 family B12-binding radical SAM protein [Umezakia ovalisporum]|uniref:TIGR03960 family B12-binding radical SAM protein n=2 Tax=Umezakia ovalisporum TaxID=75695 RepID=A0AA43GYZ9_9CYAN|nr:TIGR03960 family B12-binding radical SAM protein [Umezakia ovalisporum]MDH6056975.1 TIGR03960 family B12-binding radical SAM protein [Umezakia ovalisporum FSS-43]MDH6064459.1 TIGR03960 family B12-binding radical SAM protein [Umezakia ovalisporum FSS-62]MDH6068425.1 TIGR03960 family B12-binding radical SAM protein [Umezakia ovalisporum APH033B]MDH6071166.1 TIGR03960 family B12-binding radical SAM protein [Umezakia ovalisporum CobakiLakeA]MDH6074772.1 TIGR03960 family B12-binding radical SAM 
MAVAVEKLITPDILKPGRYLGNEHLAVHKPWDTATIRWALTYPEIYEVGSSNLGHIILYNILNFQPRQLCDRSYLPGPDLAEKLRTTNTPLFAVESKRWLKEFDVLGFSLSYELGATNILEMLDLAAIPLTWTERTKGNYPLIFAGGQTATSNPEPYADFFDFFALGDGEELLPEIGLVLEEGKKAKLNREQLLLDLAQIPGVYVPQFYDMAADGSVHPQGPNVPKRILRRVASPIPAYSIGLVPYIETVHDRLTLEIRRGCTRGCRFCQPGMLTRPARDVEPDEVVTAIEQGMRDTGYNEFSLLSLSCSDYLSLPAVGMEIKNRLKNENISLSLPSQRVDRFDQNIANILGGTRQGGLTFAPEAGTQRMRDIVNKGLTNEELLRGVKTAWEQGWDKIKLYFMIGLPGETDADVEGIAETVGWLQRECRGRGRKPLNFNLTISNFTPKPHTPFQWHSVSNTEFKRKQNQLRQAFRRMGGVKVNFTDVRISAMEDFVGRGDRSLGKVIRRAWELGAGMDSWYENLDAAFGAWETAIAESGLNWKYRQVEKGEWNLFDIQKPEVEIEQEKEEVSSCCTSLLPAPDSLDLPLPWDHIDTGIDKKWLQEDLKRALQAAIVPDCSFAGCSHCGVCGTDFGHNIVISPPPVPNFAGNFVPKTTKTQRLRVWFGKQGSMALVSHLDLMRLFDRVIRRAGLPIAFTGGFHPGPRIAIASALALGATSSGEIVDFELTEPVDVETFRQKLVEELPTDIPIYKVATIDLKAAAANQVMEAAEYLITVAALKSVTDAQWRHWIDCIKAKDELWWEKKTKSGNQSLVNLRSRLFDVELVTANTSIADYTAVLRYLGSCRHDGVVLRPEQILSMLEIVAGEKFQLLQIHRNQLVLGV